jgi:hypothetical protein
MELRARVKMLRADLQKALDQGINPFEKPKLGSSAYHKARAEHLYAVIKNSLNELAKKAHDYPSINEALEEDQPQALIDKLKRLESELPKGDEPTISVAGISADIKSEIFEDTKELDRCFKAKCYRSCIILCGRILETVLHRKYFDATGKDLLEKSPGIGLGNVIKKLSEEGIKMDPGLPNQIHLINQVRIHSVHKKRYLFVPNKDQTQAIMLYTKDIVSRLLGNGQ